MCSVGTVETHAHEYSWHLYVVAGYIENLRDVSVKRYGNYGTGGVSASTVDI